MAATSTAGRRARGRALLVGGLGIAGLLVGGCKGSVSVGGSQVSQKDVETQVAAQLAASVNQPTPNIDCPGGLDAKVGASIDCELTAQGDTTKYPVHVVVDSVDNGTAHFTAEVGKSPG